MTFELDEGLGILLQKIKELGIEDNTYIIYMSDNGSVPNIPGAKKYEKSYNYPLSRGKWDAYEEEYVYHLLFLVLVLKMALSQQFLYQVLIFYQLF